MTVPEALELVDALGNIDVVVICDPCGREWPLKSDSYVMFHGNVTLGYRGGLISNNFNEDGILNAFSIFCQDGCVRSALRSTLVSPHVDLPGPEATDA